MDQILVKKGDQVKQGQTAGQPGRPPTGPGRSGSGATGVWFRPGRPLDSPQPDRSPGACPGLAGLYGCARCKRETAQLAWDQLDQNAIQTNIDFAQSDVNSRKTDLANAQADFNRYADLPNQDQTRMDYEQKLRNAQTNYDLAVQKLEDLTNTRDQVHATLLAAQNAETEAPRTYQNTQNGPDSDKLALAQAQLDNANAQVAASQDALDSYDLKAPFDCTVMDINVSSNQMVGPETWAVAIADTSQWYVDTSDLNELDVVKVSLGQKVEISVDALPGVKMNGVVEEIGNTPVNQGTDVLYTVHILLNNPDPRLRWGMTMEVTFPVN